MYKKDISLNPKVDLIDDEIAWGFKGKDRAEVLEFKSGREIKADGFFVIKDSSKPQRLVPSIKLVDNHIEVDRNMATNIKGLFAAGDISGKPYQIMKAVGEGQLAGLNAVRYINNIKKSSK